MTISQVCIKCGHRNANMQYSKTKDIILMVCNRCGYRWTVEPLDRDVRLREV